MAGIEIDYEHLPGRIKDNLSAEQWEKARKEIVRDGEMIPQTTQYIDIKSGLIRTYSAGEPAPGHLLATHNLSGSRGRDDSQFEGSPANAG
jgi:hypothetical protein